jgi:hypothetical protein
MSDISNQLIKDSYNYVLQSDLSTGVVYRIGGAIPVNPIFQSGLTVNSGFTYSNGTEQPGYVLFTDGTGHAFWGPISAATQCFQYLTDELGNFILDENGDYIITETTDCFGVTSIIAGTGLSGSSTTGDVILINTAPDQIVNITGGTNIQITGTYPDFGVNYTGSTTSVQGITGITGTSGVSATTNDYGTTIINTAPDQIVTISGGTGITTGGTYPNFTITNSEPDQTVTITGGTGIEITGNYPDFGVNYTGGTNIQGITGITGTSGISASTNDYGTTIINTEPDQTVVLSAGTSMSVTGAYPNFTISYTGASGGGVATLTTGSGLSGDNTTGAVTIINTAPDQTVIITGGTNVEITGTYPNFGVNFTGATTGDYLPLSGGTVTGDTVFQSGLTANTFYSSGQVGIGTSNPNAAAIIEIASTTQGVLFPRMTKTQRDAISNPPIGLMLFVTDDNEGLYIYKTSGWVQII